jgi:hypothetical protein
MKSDLLSRELSILKRAVHFENLSSAALPIGLSQPQLSRIVARIEKDLGITLLERKSRRQSRWTPAARALAELCSETEGQFDRELRRWKTRQEEFPERLSVGVLEGLKEVAIQLSKKALIELGIQEFEIRVSDLDQLEEDFLSKKTDLILSSRAPGRRKLPFQKNLGFQTLDLFKGSGGVKIYSSFERQSLPRKDSRDRSMKLVSNSLAVREIWIREHGGSGRLPSPFRETSFRETSSRGEGSSPDRVPVLLIGNEEISDRLWKALTGTS